MKIYKSASNNLHSLLHSLNYALRNAPRIFQTHTIAFFSACLLTTTCLSSSAWASTDQDLTLANTIEMAVERDAWLTANTAAQRGLQAQSQAVDQRPNPRFSLSTMNLPTDTLRFNQENMTQLSLGISQMFPRGDSRALRSQQLSERGEVLPLQRLDRIEQIKSTVTQLWFEIYQIDQSMLLINNNQALFEQLVDISRTNYASAYGRTRQQDIIRAQLELTRLRERLSRLQEERAVLAARLNGWIYPDSPINAQQRKVVSLSPTIESLKLTTAQTQTIQKVAELTDDALAGIFFRHPMIRSLDQSVTALETAEDLARQEYAPQWGVSAAYSYRDNSPTGEQRADFVSIGVSVELPLLQRHQTDAAVAARGFDIDAMHAERLLRLRQMRAAFGTELAQLDGLRSRLDLYEQDLLPQMQAYTEATLSAYSHDESDFAEVVRARINLLDTQVEILGLQTKQQMALTRLNYFLTPDMRLAKVETHDTTEHQHDSQ